MKTGRIIFDVLRNAPVSRRCLVAMALWLATLSAQALDGTYRVTETWRVTLEYDGWGDSGYTGTKTFTGSQSATMVFRGSTYSLINRTGLQLGGIDTDLTSRTIFGNGAAVSVSGGYVFAPAFSATAHGIVFLGAFIVRVPLLDGEVPAFHGFDYYSGSGPLSSIRGGGDMRGASLTATVSSTLSLEKVVGPPTIVSQPQAESVFAGQDVTFRVTAGGDGPLSYQWRKGSAALPGKTGSSLVLPNVQLADAGSYSVIVSNSGGRVTSSSAKLAVKAPPPAWLEGWESSPLGIRRPSSNLVTYVQGDKGRWGISDTVSHFDDCGPVESYAEVLHDGGRKLLKLVSARNDLGCAENLDVQLDSRSSSTLPIPLLRDTEISFFENGSMDNPQWNGLFGCILRPCGDTVHLRLVDERANEVLYIFQRAPNYVEHAFTNGPSLSGYLEVFLDPSGGTFSRNLYNDFARIAGANGPGRAIHGVGFAIGAAGWATLDDLRIGSTNAPVAPADSTAPRVMVSSPRNNARVSQPLLTLSGTAGDNVAVSLVEVQLNGRAFQPAAGTDSWIIHLMLEPGTNTLLVRAKDPSGNVSRDAAHSLVYVVTGQVTMNVEGAGAIAPDLDGQNLELGRSYTVKAIPAPGHLFAGWSGDVNSTAPVLSFVMQSNLVLVANFIPNPFIPIKGSYNGLFYETNVVRFFSSGFFTLALTDRGTYSARLQLGGKRHAASGAFALDGRATNAIARSGTNALNIDWDLELAGDMGRVSGRVSDGLWFADLSGDLAQTNAGVFQGRYTLAIPGGTDATARPGGDGFGDVSIDSRGSLSFSGSLAEGTAVRQRVPVSKDGYWPLFASLYGGKGSLLGWVKFEDDGTNDLAGLVDWIKPASSAGKYYAAGFATESPLTGSRYVVPASSNRVLNFENGRLVLGRAGVASTNSFTLLSNNKIAAMEPARLKMTMDLAKGLFKGSVSVPGDRKPFAVKGALLQRQTNGAGFFLTTNQSGQVRLESIPE